MPRQTKKSGLFGKLGKRGREAFDSHKADTTSYGAGGDLPPGIEGGIAQLVDCRFDVYKKGEGLKGEYFFYAAGIVKSPKDHNGVRIEGLRTSIMEPVCDTPGRKREGVDDHIDWILNEFRKLGVDTGDASYDQLEDLAEAIKQTQPHFRFRTWQGQVTDQYPNPRVNHEWRGLCEHAEDDGADDVVDDTEEDDADEDDAGGVDLADLAAKADDGDENAQIELGKLAEEAGIDAEEIETWAEVADAISNPADDDDEDAEPPAKGKVCYYKPPRARKSVECETTAVFANKETCNLKSLDDGKIFKAVPWGKLLEE